MSGKFRRVRRVWGLIVDPPAAWRACLAAALEGGGWRALVGGRGSVRALRALTLG